ncbi:MAG TPA: ABC transporter permease, partial [Candidatus Limnocylindrales bacterium]
MRALTAQLAMELRLTLRRGENLVVTLGIPLVLLVFLANVDLIGSTTGESSRLDQLVPGILCVALISTGLVSLGIATAFERGNGTLKRLASSPLPRWALVAAKTAAVLATVVV